MNDKELIDTFLAERRLCRFAVTRKNGGQLIRPIWYLWEPGKFFISTKTDAVHTRIVRRNPKISILVDRDVRPYAGIVCEGEVELVEGVGTDHEMIGRIAERYLGREQVKNFLAGPMGRQERVRFVVHPRRWTIWDFSADPPIWQRPGVYE